MKTRRANLTATRVAAAARGELTETQARQLDAQGPEAGVLALLAAARCLVEPTQRLAERHRRLAEQEAHLAESPSCSPVVSVSPATPSAMVPIDAQPNTSKRPRAPRGPARVILLTRRVKGWWHSKERRGKPGGSLDVCGTFYDLCSVLDGYRRSIVDGEIRESMTEAPIKLLLQRVREKRPRAAPRIISDNGPPFIAKDFKEFIRLCGMTHVKTSPYYPQSNPACACTHADREKLERRHQSLKGECIRPDTPLSLGDARRLVGQTVEHDHTVRLPASACAWHADRPPGITGRPLTFRTGEAR